MTNFVKTTDGKVHVVWSDNVDEKTMHLIPISSTWGNGQYDPESASTNIYDYEDIAIVSNDRNLVEGFELEEREYIGDCYWEDGINDNDGRM